MKKSKKLNFSEKSNLNCNWYTPRCLDLNKTPREILITNFNYDQINTIKSNPTFFKLDDPKLKGLNFVKNKNMTDILNNDERSDKKLEAQEKKAVKMNLNLFDVSQQPKMSNFKTETDLPKIENKKLLSNHKLPKLKITSYIAKQDLNKVKYKNTYSQKESNLTYYNINNLINKKKKNIERLLINKAKM